MNSTTTKKLRSVQTPTPKGLLPVDSCAVPTFNGTHKTPEVARALSAAIRETSGMSERVRYAERPSRFGMLVYAAAIIGLLIAGYAVLSKAPKTSTIQTYPLIRQ